MAITAEQGGAPGIWWVEVRVADQYSAMQKTTFYSEQLASVVLG